MIKIQNLIIREAQESDAEWIANLSTQLGYPSTPSDILVRLTKLNSNALNGIFIAEYDTVIGWIHVSVIESLESDPFAEIRGLVVDDSHRGSGVGTQLVTTAEEWSYKKGCVRIRVRTSMVRVESIKFYEKLGYLSKKIQNILDKSLTGQRA